MTSASLSGGPVQRAAIVSVVIAVLGCAMCIGAAHADERPSPLALCRISPSVPAAPKNSKVYSDVRSADGAAAIQHLLDSLTSGESVVFAPGLYRVGSALVVHTPGIRLYGSGATLFFTKADEGGITIRSDGVAIYGFTLDQASKERKSTPWSGGIAIYDDENHVVRRVRGSIIEGNTIKNAAGAGIFVYSADQFTVADNTVWRSYADGIHVTAGASNGRIIGNNVSQTGDDMIAVVSYAGSAAVATASERYSDWADRQRDLSKNIYIAANRVTDQYWGRGISIVGGSSITIEANLISGTPLAAGIYLVRETSYRTFGIHHVLIRENQLTNIETDPASFQRGDHPQQPTGHGAIEIGSLQDEDELDDPALREAFAVSEVAVIDNRVSHARYAGIRAGVGASQTVSRIVVDGNTLTDVGGSAVVEIHPGVEGNSMSCNDNEINNSHFLKICASDAPSNANSSREGGAVLNCSRDGALLESS